MTDLLFGAADNYTWSQIKPWAQSIRDSGFDGEVVLLVYRGDLDTIAAECEALEISVVNTDFDSWGRSIDHNAGGRDTQSHQMRFFHMWQYLSDYGVENLRYVIATDVRDVLFQRNPSTWLETNVSPAPSLQLVAPSEGIRYCDEAWGASNLQSGFGPFVWQKSDAYEIFNVGTIAGGAEAMKELSLFLYSMGEGRFIPNDQSSFNLLVNGGLMDVKKIPHDRGWACQCGTMVDPEKIETFRPFLLTPEPTFDDDGYAFTSYGEKFYLLHQWDRVPAISGKIEARYA